MFKLIDQKLNQETIESIQTNEFTFCHESIKKICPDFFIRFHEYYSSYEMGLFNDIRSKELKMIKEKTNHVPCFYITFNEKQEYIRCGTAINVFEHMKKFEKKEYESHLCLFFPYNTRNNQDDQNNQDNKYRIMKQLKQDFKKIRLHSKVNSQAYS